MELIRIQDHDLRELQRHNELRQFLDYERRLAAAYAQSQNPHPRRRMPQDSGGRICRDRIFDALG